MNRHIYRVVAAVLTAICIFSCNDARNSEVYRVLTDVDSYIKSRPDSALAVLEGIDKAELTTNELEAKYALLMSMALNKNYIDLQSDSIIAPAVRYYERRGSQQEKFLTQYYLARIYQNADDYENAMKAIVKAEEYDFGRIDHAYVGRLYAIKTTIYINCYSIDEAIESLRQELRYHKSGNNPALTKMVEENTVNECTKVIIERRLELLNKVIVSYITDTSAANRKANEELEMLVSDRDAFIASTRVTLESSHPAFFRYLHKKELTDREINYCCLYLIGLKGKDIGEYINLKRHYTYGSVIRQKLGLTENDTNLSLYLKKLQENTTA